MSAPADTAAQLNIKTPSGTLINLYASSVYELGELIDALEDQAAKITAIESLFTATSNVAAAGIVAPPSQQNVAAPATAQPNAPAGQVMCDCGVPAKRIEAGVSKATGRPYKAFYACSKPREQQCQFKLTA